MPRLFWKFFTTIWLTLAATVTVIIVLVNLFQTAPFARQLDDQKRDLILSLAVSILEADGSDAAQRFVTVSEKRERLGLTIEQTSLPTGCDMNANDSRNVRKGGICYTIHMPQNAGFILDNLAVLMPWFAIFVSSTISAVALARYLIRPVVHLRDGLSALAHGRFDIRIGDKMAGRRDEVTALAHDFDSTAARLQELQDSQQRLFHDVSHELRSPLSRLQAAVGVLRQSPAKLSSMLDRMDREVERLDVLVGEVLTLARLTTLSRLPLKTQALDVIDLLSEILGDAAFEAQAREVSIATKLEGAFLANVEGELIYRALENVIRNAIKYTREHSEISVRSEAKGDLLKVIVADQGPGVPPEELERIFQPFARGSGAEPRGGYGLGLAIARQAIERHGGRVYASLPKIGGLTITIELPRRAT